MATMAPPPTDAKPVKKWDDTMLAHLFLCIYDTIDISFTPENKIAIATMMNERFNHSVNWNGIRQHLQKLKKKEGDKKDEKNDAVQASPKQPKQAKKPKQPMDPKTPKTGRAKNVAIHRTPGTPSPMKRGIDVDVDEYEDDFKPKKLKLEMQAPNFGQRHEAEPNPSFEGEA